jgi:uncharacterized membrane protein YtjA (UPF0391 family)
LRRERRAAHHLARGPRRAYRANAQRRSTGTSIALDKTSPLQVHPTEYVMLSWSLTFLLFALIAAAFGFTGIAGTAAWLAQILFVLFLVMFVVSLIAGGRRSPA